MFTMWRKKFCNSAQIPVILHRTVNSANFCSSIATSHCSNCWSSSQNFSRFYSSSPASCFRGRQAGKCFLSSKVLRFSYPIGVAAMGNWNLFVENGNLFCSQPKSAEKLHCWNCGAGAENAMTFLFCRACRSIQPVDEAIDYFQIFGLQRKYEIELEELEKKYKDWQKKLHPDLVHSKTQQERDYAAAQSARVIEAYCTLADPLSRAIYSVKLEGVPVDEEESITDSELLAEIMEIREAVEEAEDAKALTKIQDELQGKMQYWSNSFNAAYASRNYEEALASIRRMTYYKRANEEIVKKL